RIHTDSHAVQMNRELGARAFTTGRDIFFNRGEYNTDSAEGKRLLAHELVHTVQQGASSSFLQTYCDPATLVSRTSPAYFPREEQIINVFNGNLVISQSQAKRTSVALIQQALVDLGYNLGTYGPNNDGVDYYFGPVTKQAVIDFQNNESIQSSSPGVVDQTTLKCIDEKRAGFRVQPQQTGTTAEEDFRIEGEGSSTREEDILFDRGSAVLSETSRRKVQNLVTRNNDSLLTNSASIYGFISEDEIVEYGETLAMDRIASVSSEIIRQKIMSGNISITSILLPLIPEPRPHESIGISDYRSRRKVEVVLTGSNSRTASCPVNSPQHRDLETTEESILNNDISRASGWMDRALSELNGNTQNANDALAAYFGNTQNRSEIINNLVTWRRHLRSHIPSNSNHGTECDDFCRFAVAYNRGSGSAATMTLCSKYFDGFSGHDQLSFEDKRALVVMHEAGHGSIGVRDIAYGHFRLIEFLHDYSTIAEDNTDSYVLMILCLANVGNFCTPPSANDTYIGLNSSEEEAARRGVAWLQSWLIWTNIDTSTLYRRMNQSRNSGDGLQQISTYSAGIYDLLTNSFNIHRPQNDPPVTFSEQIVVSAVIDRINIMERATKRDLTYIKDTVPLFPDYWQRGPGDLLNLTNAYFSLSSDRLRVEFLLPLIIEATPQVSSSLHTAYENFIKDFIRNGRWQNQP
ncbi:MAG: DUF4157 domain-containing protein, partial [Balneolaceae bacterium]